ncbi:ABC transporter substrate-binding protein [Leisingera sp.]|uniref:ABC transporter substrate-binding protein n=1 Tax=Leisingera sp. TaxID=1879318 RepID=UPI002B266779|nr:ABC transporter substrate-binding protein [Leisingera sp.]
MTQTSRVLAPAVLAAVLGLGSVLPALADGMVRLALNADIRGTNPGVTRDGNTDQVHGHIIEGLVTYGSDFSIIPMLAEGYEISDDGRTYTFNLRKGVKFHNGAEMTAKDVEWSWNRLAGEESESHCKNFFNGQNNIEVTSAKSTDEHTFVITLAEPYAVFLATMARFDCGSMAVLHPDSVNADGSWNAPIGTGPYMMGDHAPGRYVELNRFADYTSREGAANGYGGGKHATVDTLRWEVVGEGAVSKTALQAGDLDLVDIDAMTAAELKDKPGFKVDATESAVWDTYLLNSSDPLLSDVQVRRAIAHAIDPQRIMAAITEGFGNASPSPVPPMSVSYTGVQAQYPEYNVAKAKQLLAEAGYNGEEITILATRRNGAYYERALMAQAMMMDAGMNAKLKVVEWGSQLEAYRNGSGYQMQSFTFSPRLHAGLSFEMFTGGAQRKAWKSPPAVDLVNEALRVSDPAELQAIIDKLHQGFMEEVPAIGLGHRTLFTGMSDKVEGFENWGAGLLRGWMLKVNG